MRTPREDSIEALSHASIEALDKLYENYVARNDSYNAGIIKEAIAQQGQVQTTKLTHCGKLFEHRHYDPNTGRIWFTYTGDIRAMLAPFTRGGIGFKLNYELAQETLRDYERAAEYTRSQSKKR